MDGRSFNHSGEGSLFQTPPEQALEGGAGATGVKVSKRVGVWGIPLPTEGEGPSGQKRPPAAAPPPRAPFKPASRRAGAGESPSPPPPPPAPAVQHHSGSQVPGTRAQGPTPQRVSQSLSLSLSLSRTHTHTHTHTHQQTKGLDTPVPSRPPGRRGRGIPCPAPLQGKLWTTSCGGEGDRRREGGGLDGGGLSSPPKKVRGPLYAL